MNKQRAFNLIILETKKQLICLILGTTLGFILGILTTYIT